MEFDRTPSPIREGIAEPFDQTGGFLEVPTGPAWAWKSTRRPSAN